MIARLNLKEAGCGAENTVLWPKTDLIMFQVGS